MRLNLIPGTLLTAVAVFSPLPCHAEEATVLSRSLKGERLNDLGIWQLRPDKSFEIFVTAVSGHVGCYRADNLKPLWETKVQSQSLTAPVIGDFMGSGAPILAFASAGGTIYFVWPGTGETIAELKVEASFALPPTVLPGLQGDALVLGDEKGNITIATVDPETGAGSVRHSIPSSLPGRTDFSVRGSFSQPITSSDLNGDGTHELITVNDSGVLQVISSLSAGDTPRRYYTRLAQQSRATTLVAAGDLAGNGSGLIAFGVDASLHVYSWDPAQSAETAVKKVLQGPAFGASRGHLLIGQVNADDTPDLVSTSDNTIAARYLGHDLNGNQALLDIPARHLTTISSPFTPAVAFTGSGGKRLVASIAKDGVASIWDPNSAGDNAVVSYDKVPTATGFTPAGNLSNDGKLSMVAWNQSEFKLHVIKFETAVESGSAPLLTGGANYSRNGQWGANWRSTWSSYQSRAQAKLDEATRSLESSPDDSESPTDAASTVAGLDPDHPIAQHFRDRHARTSAGEVVLFGILALLLMGVSGFAIAKLRHKR